MQLGIRSCGNETNSRLLRACSDNALAKTNLSPAPAVELGVSLPAAPTDIEHSGLPRRPQGGLLAMTDAGVNEGNPSEIASSFASLTSRKGGGGRKDGGGSGRNDGRMN